jgi:hypothetical protein
VRSHCFSAKAVSKHLLPITAPPHTRQEHSLRAGTPACNYPATTELAKEDNRKGVDLGPEGSSSSMAPTWCFPLGKLFGQAPSLCLSLIAILGASVLQVRKLRHSKMEGAVQGVEKLGRKELGWDPRHDSEVYSFYLIKLTFSS